MPKGVYKRSSEHIRESTSHLPKHPNHWKGKKLSYSHRMKLINNHKGTTGYHHSDDSKKKMSMIMKKVCNPSKSEKHWNWKGGITPVLLQIRHSLKYRQWRSDIFTRDNFTCQECGANHCWIEAHHIKEFSIIIEENNIKTLDQALNCEELWNINNGITYCRKCHDKTKK